MRNSKRNKHYRRCQEIIDDLHARVERGEFVNEARCKATYGKADYNALLHELRLMNADLDYVTMTPAMEWMHSSQYFLNKIEDEKRVRVTYWVAVISAIASAISAFVAALAVYYAHAEPPQNEHPRTERCAKNSRGNIEESVEVTADRLYGTIDCEEERNHCNQIAHDGKNKKSK